MKRLMAWLKANHPFALAERNQRALDQLQRHGLTDSDRAYFMSLCRSGRPMPSWLVDRMIGAADAAKAAGEEQAT